MSWICPLCERELRNPNQWHNCVKVSVDSLFEGKSDDLVAVFDQLLSEITEWKNVVASTTQNCIVFVHHKTFLIIRPMKTQLDLKFYSLDQLDESPVMKSTAYSGKYENHIRVSRLQDLNAGIFSLIKNSYTILGPAIG